MVHVEQQHAIGLAIRLESKLTRSMVSYAKVKRLDGIVCDQLFKLVFPGGFIQSG